MNHLTRRQFLLGSAGIIISTHIAGCGNPNSTPVRTLTFRDARTTETEDGWLVSLVVVNKVVASDERGTFHNVVLHGYDRERTQVCSKEIGTVGPDRHEGNRVSVEMACSAFPVMLTYSAAESPCDEDVRTVIKIAVYDEEQGWLLERHQRECGEGLPPEPRD